MFKCIELLWKRCDFVLIYVSGGTDFLMKAVDALYAVPGLG
jgi:hypothetical protein